MEDAEACFRKGGTFDSRTKECVPMAAARKALDEKTLNKKIMFNGRITTYKDEIDRGLFVRSQIAEVPSVRFNRVKYNRMNGEEQKEYDEKLNTKKTEYWLFEKGGTFFAVPKAVYIYAKEKGI